MVLSVALLFCPVFSPAFFALYITAVIAFIKAANIAAGFIRQKGFVSVHSVMNKVTGALLFLFPLTLSFTDLRCSAAVVCAAATAAAVHEGYLIRAKTTA